MIALYIIGGILLVIVILLNLPVSAELKYYGGQFSIKVKYLWLTLYPPKPKKEKVKKAKKSEQVITSETHETEQPPETADIEEIDMTGEKDISPEEKKKLSKAEKKRAKARKKREKEELKEKIKLIKMVLVSSKKGLKRILKGIYISDILVDITVADEDAAKAAINYGKISAAVYDGIAFLRTFFTVSIQKITVNCIYNSSTSSYEGECTVRLRPATVLVAAVSILWHLLIQYIKMKQEEKQLMKAQTERNDIKWENTQSKA